MNGAVVQLIRGKDKAFEMSDPMAALQRFSRYGQVTVIDLDAALGTGDNAELISRMCTLAECHVGGGIRSVEKGRAYLATGALKIIVGTEAKPGFLQAFRPDQVIAAVDEYDGEMMTHGWQRKTGVSSIEYIESIRPYVSGFLYTLIDREGLMGGAANDRFTAFIEKAGKPVTIAGGITAADEVASFDRLGADCQVGMALYTGKLDPTEALLQCIDFEKCGGMVPGIVQDAAGRVMMLAYMTPEALRITLNTGHITFWSRRRQCLWEKGESSGNHMTLISIRADCDRDTLLLHATAEGPACHTGLSTCFGDGDFRLEDLQEIISGRLESGSGTSYSVRLARNRQLLHDKIREEADELIAASGERATVHETADLIYHIMVLLTAEGIPLSRIGKELRGRRRQVTDAALFPERGERKTVPKTADRNRKRH